MKRLLARLNDSAMCMMMDRLQRRHRLPADFPARWNAHLARQKGQSRDEHFAAPLKDEVAFPNASRPLPHTWPSPVQSRHPENNRCHALLFPCAAGWNAPTVLMLHALMSASDRGYRDWARRFNQRGWNAIFVHLPYHYSRTPRGHWNGELAITADTIRSSEALRGGVAECRQLMACLRALGCREFGLWACSYGGWIGALLASVEADFRWVALIEPIINVHHVIWQSPAGAAVRRELRRVGMQEESLVPHYPLISPAQGEPLCGAERVIFAAGEYDRISRAEDIARLSDEWRGSESIVEPQGHFGFRLMRATWRRLEERALI